MFLCISRHRGMLNMNIPEAEKTVHTFIISLDECHMLSRICLTFRGTLISTYFFFVVFYVVFCILLFFFHSFYFCSHGVVNSFFTYMSFGVFRLSFTLAINKGNSSIPLFEIHKSIEKNTKSGLQTKIEGNASNIRGELRHNRNTTLKCNTQRNYNITMAIFLT